MMWIGWLIALIVAPLVTIGAAIGLWLGGIVVAILGAIIGLGLTLGNG